MLKRSRQFREEMSVEVIKERIRENLAGIKDLGARFDKLEKSAPLGWKEGPLPLSLSSPSGSVGGRGRGLKERFISWGLRHKEFVKRVPLAKAVLKRLYHSLQSSEG
ncbi:MAG TPA: hypothetical protein VJM57_00150 [Thermodesulfobacteriota bacterium]|nr:hypothetical protein [Thermodesulfobacteriota bacterium]